MYKISNDVNVIRFKSDNDFADFCVAPYVVKRDSAYVGAYTQAYLDAISEGSYFMIEDMNSWVYEKKQVKKKVPPVFVDGSPVHGRDSILVQLPVKNLMKYGFKEMAKRRHELQGSMNCLNPQEYLNQLHAVEQVAHDGLIALLRNNPKGRYIDFDYTNDEELEAYQYWGAVRTQDLQYDISAVGLDEKDRLVALVSGGPAGHDIPKTWVDLEDWTAEVRGNRDYWIIYSPLYYFAANNLQYAKPGPFIISREAWLKDAISSMVNGEGLTDPDEIFKRLVRDYPQYPMFIDGVFDADSTKSIIRSFL
jgi:hypothetical protein